MGWACGDERNGERHVSSNSILAAPRLLWPRFLQSNTRAIITFASLVDEDNSGSLKSSS